MAIEGNATGKMLKGRINVADTLVISAYGVAVKNGFKGTEEEWLDSMKAVGALTCTEEDGIVSLEREEIDYSSDVEQAVAEYMENNPILASQATIGEVTLLASAWKGDTSPYSQVVAIEGVTENSQVDLTPSIEQLAIFHQKDLAFVAENDGGTVRVYALGDKPLNDYTIQVTITEVIV
jgi:hypothetical protein